MTEPIGAGEDVVEPWRARREALRQATADFEGSLAGSSSNAVESETGGDD